MQVLMPSQKNFGMRYIGPRLDAMQKKNLSLRQASLSKENTKLKSSAT